MTMDYDRQYPNRLRVIRLNAGYQQQHVARMLGHKDTVSLCQWENENTMPNGTNLIKLCVLYSSTPQELYPEYYQQIERILFARFQ